MQVLPEGFVLPPVPYLGGVLAASLLVTVWLYRRRPAITQQMVVGLAPWMGVGAGLYALEQVAVVPPVLVPLVTAPIVYLTTFVIAGAIVAAVGHRRPNQFAIGSGPGLLALTGTSALVLVLAVAVLTAFRTPPVRIFWPGMASVGAIVLTSVVWVIARRYQPIDWTGYAGMLVVFGHTLDGLSTAVGLKFLGFGEQTPMSQLVIDLGGVWLFVLIKVVIALIVVSLMAEYVREEPSEGYLLLAAIAAVGLGPGVHNVILFMIAG